MERRFNGSHTLYDITVELNSLGGIEFTNKTVFFRYDISYDASTARYVLEDAAYVSLSSPNFNLLTIDQIRQDRNIVEIAKYLLSQRPDERLEASSRVVSVSRDLPYYRLTFLAKGNVQLSYVILLNINGAVQVIDVTEEKREEESETSTSAQSSTSSSGQTQTQTQSQSSSQSQTQTQTTTPRTTATTTTTRTVTQTGMPSVTTVSSSSNQGGSSQSSTSFSTTARSSQSSSSTSSSTSGSSSSSTEVRYRG